MVLQADICGRAKSEEGHFILGHQSDWDLWALAETAVIHFKRGSVGDEGPLGMVMGPRPMIEILKVELFYGILNLERQALA